MRIDLVSEHASPLAGVGGEDAGGQNVHVAALGRALAEQGATVRVHTRRDDPDLPPVVPLAPGVEVVHVTAGPPRPVPRDELWPYMDDFAAGLVQEWGRDRPAVAHAHFWMSGYASLVAGRHVGVPVALTYHALGREKRRQQGAKDTSPPERVATEDWLARRADLIVATTRAEAREHRRRGAPAQRTVVVPCGVDLADFHPGPGAAGRGAGARSRGRHLRVGVVSRLVERKGIANVIEAIAQVPGAELVIAGGPPPGRRDRDPAVEHYRDVARGLGCADRVELVGALPRHRVAALLRSVDVVACCPWYEPFGLVALEAMACGVPVVASKVGGLAETVIDGRTGLHVPPRRPAAIAEALASLADDEPRRAAMASAAASRARLYAWDHVGRRTLTALAHLAGAPGAGGAADDRGRALADAVDASPSTPRSSAVPA